MHFFHHEWFIDEPFGYILRTHSPPRKPVEFVLQKDVTAVSMPFQLPVEPYRQHTGETTAVWLIKVSAMASCKMVGKSSKDMVNVLIILHGISVGHIFLSSRHI